MDSGLANVDRDALPHGAQVNKETVEDLQVRLAEADFILKADPAPSIVSEVLPEIKWSNNPVFTERAEGSFSASVNSPVVSQTPLGLELLPAVGAGKGSLSCVSLKVYG